MSVDIHQLTIHLPPKEQEAVRRAYRDQAQNETAAFLWCFFLGIAGAHRFYLRQWGRGLAHLILVVAAIAALVLGVALAWPPALTAGVVVPLLLIALLWMVVDLFRIDDEVSRHNLALAERLTAGAFLADGARGRMALETLAAVEQTEMRAPEPVAVAVTTAQDDRGGAVAEAVVATPESAGVGEGVSAPVAVQVATPEELAAAADAQAADPAPVTVQTVTGIAGIAEGEGYRAVPAGPAGPAADDASATLEPEPSSEAAVAEVTTGAGWSPEAVAGAAAAAAASAAAFAPLFRSDAEAQPAAEAYPTTEVTPAEAVTAQPMPIAEAASDMTWSDFRPASPLAGDAYAAAAPQEPAPPYESEPSIFAAGPVPATSDFALDPLQGRPRDLTDLGTDVAFTPIADIEPEGAYHVRIGDLGDLAPDESYDAGDTGASEATLLLVPEETAPAPAMDEPAPAAPVWPAVPAWPTEGATESTPPATSAAEGDAERDGNTLAELAGFGAAGAAGGALAWELTHRGAATEGANAAQEDQPAAAAPALAGDAPATQRADTSPAGAAGPAEAAAEQQPAPVAAPPATAEKPHHLLKHIKVVRQVKVGDEVVEESFAEAYIDPDEDPEPVRQRLREQLRWDAEQRRAQQQQQ